MSLGDISDATSRLNRMAEAYETGANPTNTMQANLQGMTAVASAYTKFQGVILSAYRIDDAGGGVAGLLESMAYRLGAADRIITQLRKRVLAIGDVAGAKGYQDITAIFEKKEDIGKIEFPERSDNELAHTPGNTPSEYRNGPASTGTDDV